MSNGPKDVMDGLHRLLKRGGRLGRTRVIGEEVLPLLERLVAAINEEPDPVTQQKAIEMLVMQQAARMGNAPNGLVVIEGIAKHARQLLLQAYDEGHLIRSL